jgi:hypothetical protein
MTADAQFLSGQKLKQSSILSLFANKKGLTVSFEVIYFFTEKVEKMAIYSYCTSQE